MESNKQLTNIEKKMKILECELILVHIEIMLEITWFIAY